MNKFYVYLGDSITKADACFADPSFEVIFLSKTIYKSLQEVIENVASNDDYILCARPYQLGSSVDEFLTNGLNAIKKGVKIIFRKRMSLSFHLMIDYNKYTTIEEISSAFLSVYSLVITEVYSHKNGNKRNCEYRRKLRNYWLAFIYHNAKDFRGTLTTYDITKALEISNETIRKYRHEIREMLSNGKESYLDSLVAKELSSSSKESKEDRQFKEKLTKALESKCTQMSFLDDLDIVDLSNQ